MEPPQTARATDSNSLDAVLHGIGWIATEAAAADASSWQEVPLDLAYLGCGNGQTLYPSPEDVAILTQQTLETSFHSGAYTFDVGQANPVRLFQYSQSARQDTCKQSKTVGLQDACQ